MEMIIYTPYGDRYYVDLKTGNIRGEGFSYSGGWKFMSFKHVLKREFIPLTRIQKNPELLKSIEWRFKNGNPRYTVRDIDHGTIREWGNTKVHGVEGAYIDAA